MLSITPIWDAKRHRGLLTALSQQKDIFMPDMAQYKIKLLNEFECRTDKWSFADFESRLRELRSGASYHDAKNIINGAHRQGKWPNTVKRYLATNFKAHGNVSAEFTETFRQVLDSMSSAEKQSFGI